jgi:hypothetical protein
VLAGKFLNGVGGYGAGKHGLGLGESGIVSVGCGGGCVEDTLDTGFTGRVEDVEGACEVRSIGADGILDGLGYGRDRGLVEDVVHTAAGGGEGILIEDIGLTEVKLSLDGFNVGDRACAQVVDTSYIGTFCEEGASDA